MKSEINLQDLYNKLPSFLRNPNPEVFLSDNYVVLDFETTNIRKGSPYEDKNRVLFTAWKVGPGHPKYSRQEQYKCKIRWGSEFTLHTLIEDIERSEFLVAHFTKFELGWLQRIGLDLYNTLAYCTLLGEYVIAGNRKFDLDLDSTLKRYGLEGKESVVSLMIKAGVCPSEIPKPWLQEYGIQDVVQTERLFLEQRDVIYNTGLLPTLYTRSIFTNPLVDIQAQGMALDKSRVETICQNNEAKLRELQKTFDDTFGVINTNSGPQKAELIYDKLKFSVPKDRFGREIRTDKGNLKTDIDTLVLLKAKTKKQKFFVSLMKEISNVSNALSKNLNKMLLCIKETTDGIITFVFNQAVTGTHRLSSNGDNYSMQGQNIPRIFKPLFKARKKGWRIGEADYAQLEYRGAVFLGKDKAGIRSIQENIDRHDKTSRILTDAGQPTNRQDAKEHTFKPLFGGTSGTKAERTYYESFRQEHRDLAEVQQSWLEEVLNKGTLRTITGLIFYWPDTRILRSGFVTNTHNIFNYPIQSFCTAEIVPIGVTFQWHLLKLAELASFLVNTIHDSSIGEIAPGEEEEYEKITTFAFIDCVIKYLKDVYNIEFNLVPLEVEINFKDYWNDSPKWREKYLNEQ